MSRITLAFRCFFKLLFSGSLPSAAGAYLPSASSPALTEQTSKSDEKKAETSKEPPKEKPKPRKNLAQHHTEGSLAMLALLQREGRLVDFLQEEIEDYDDADIGAAVRDIHRGCRKVLKEHLTIEAVMPGEEDDRISVAEGFDPGEIKLVGAVSGEPPFKGVLRHHGWKVTDNSLPNLTGDIDRRVLAPAQVEVGA